jgi:hypothetical protein
MKHQARARSSCRPSGSLPSRLEGERISILDEFAAVTEYRQNSDPFTERCTAARRKRPQYACDCLRPSYA